MTNTQGVEVVINELRDELVAWGIGVPFSLKRRDPREPGRTEKEAFEDELFATFLSQFRKQKKGVRELLTSLAPDRKAINYLEYLSEDFWLDEGFMAKIARILTRAVKHGIVLFDDAVGLTMDYTLTNAVASKWASKYTFDLIRGINKTTQDVLQSVFKTFVDTPGMTIGDVVNLLPYTENRALLIATTETTRVYAQAEMLAGQALKEEYPGVQIIKRWWTNQDDRVCAICQPLHGQEQELEKWFDGVYENPPAHVGCILPGNEIVIPGSVSGAAKSFYVGPAIEITLSDGSKLSVTENHPILRADGWIRAKHISEGDYLIGGTDSKRIATTINPDNYNAPTMIEEVFTTLKMTSSMCSTRMPSSSVDFYSDGIFIHGDIDIISIDGFLNSGIKRNKHILKHELDRDGIRFGSLMRERLFDSGLSRHWSSFSRLMSSLDLGSSLFGSHFGPLHRLGFRLSPWLNTRGEESLAEGPSIDPSLSREFVFRFASNITRKKVIEIRNFNFSGHVYDLQVNPYELYICNGVIVKNCRCWTTTTTRLP